MDLKTARLKLISDMKESNPEVFEQAKRNRAIGSLFPEKKPVNKINIEEEFFMARTLPRRNVEGTPDVPQQQTPEVASTGIRSAELLSQSLLKSITFKPKALIVDKDSAEKMKVNMELPEIQHQIKLFESDEANRVMGEDGPRIKNYPSIRVLRDTCLRTGQDPLTFAETDENGVIITEMHKPVVQGFVVTFPASEGIGEVTSIVKKANFVNEIVERGGSYLVGDVDEPKLDKGKYEIPVIIKVTPYARKAKDGEVVNSNRISGHLAATREEAWFPKGTNVSMYSIFDRFPVEDYSLSRVIPRNIHNVVDVQGKKVAIVDLEKEKAEKDRSKLPKYAVTPNTLSNGFPGAEIAAALNINESTLTAAFKRAGSAASDQELTTTADFISSLLNDARTKKNEYNDVLNMLIRNQQG